MLVLFVACGGSDEAPTQDSDATATSSPESEARDPAPLNGPLIWLPAVGLFSVDRDTGDAVRLAMPEEYTAVIEVRPRIFGENVYILTAEDNEGQSFSHNAVVLRLSLSGQNGSTVARVGSDRESDDDTSLAEFPEIHIAAGSVWVVNNEFGDSMSTLTGYDLTSGATVGSVSREFASGYVSDGDNPYVYTPEGILLFHPASLTFEVVVPNGADLTTLLATGVDLKSLSFDGSMESGFGSGEPFFALRKPNEAGRPEDGALVFGDGHLWMSYKSGLGTDGSLAYKGVLGFNLLTELFDVALPTHTYEGYPLETLSTPDELFWSDGSLFVIDSDNNDVILAVDTVSGTSRLAYSPCPSEQSCDVLWNESDPGVPWIEVTRWTDQGDGPRTGERFLERLDAATGSLVAQYPFAGFLSVE